MKIQQMFYLTSETEESHTLASTSTSEAEKTSGDCSFSVASPQIIRPSTLQNDKKLRKR